MLAEAETEELNFILLNINCSALAEVVSRPTMDMLTGSDQRLPELHVLARSVLHAIYLLEHVMLIGVSMCTEVEQKFFSLTARHRPIATSIVVELFGLVWSYFATCAILIRHVVVNHSQHSVHAFKHDVLTVLCSSCSLAYKAMQTHTKLLCKNWNGST